MGRHTRRILLGLAVVAVGAAALVANLALLGLASERDDPVGRLRPVVPGLTAAGRPPAAVETQPTPVGTDSEPVETDAVQTQRDEPTGDDDEDADD